MGKTDLLLSNRQLFRKINNFPFFLHTIIYIDVLIRDTSPKKGFYKRGIHVRRKYNPYLLPPWLRTIREIGRQLIIPFTIFQGIRTLILPTTFDVILLLVFLLISAAYYMDMI